MGELKERQLQILRLVAEGCRTKEIAASLHLTDKAASHEIRNILARLGVDSRIAAVVKALKGGEIKLEEINV